MFTQEQAVTSHGTINDEYKVVPNLVGVDIGCGTDQLHISALIRSTTFKLDEFIDCLASGFFNK